jgi:hypothetical protein
MSIKPINGFVSLETHHCITGSLRQIYEFYHYPISEEMLLGLGAGVGFIYWHTRGALPFLGGRANIKRPGEEGLEKAIGRRTGVAVASIRTDSASKAEKTLLEMLEADQPVMLILDMGYLPYFDFGGQEFHFGYHAVVACGYDPGERQVLIADRDQELHPVSMEDLAKARGSKYKPFPPQHAWYTFNFSHAQPPKPSDVLCAIHLCARGMLEPPIKNFGIKGIHKAAQQIRQWHKVLSEKDLRETCINTAIMIDARGGTGGGLFRCMYARFLEEAGGMTGRKELFEAAKGMQTTGDCWETAAGLFEQAYRAEIPGKVLDEVCNLLPQIAQQEERIWAKLYHLSTD